MKTSVFFMAGGSEALRLAKAILCRHGVTFTDTPNTSVTHLLLGAPAFRDDGALKDDGRLEDILAVLNKDVCVFGGKLNHPALDGFSTFDLLQDPVYLAENADITAYCALKVAQRHMPMIWKNCPVLIIGNGRIGTCLARLLKSLGARVCVALRRDRALWETLGYDTLDSRSLGYDLGRFSVIFNTVPAPVISQEGLRYCQKDCLKIELASLPGIEGTDVIIARGLPGKEAPESSGKLIAQTVLRRLQEGVAK